MRTLPLCLFLLLSLTLSLCSAVLIKRRDVYNLETTDDFISNARPFRLYRYQPQYRLGNNIITEEATTSFILTSNAPADVLQAHPLTMEVTHKIWGSSTPQSRVQKLQQPGSVQITIKGNIIYGPCNISVVAGDLSFKLPYSIRIVETPPPMLFSPQQDLRILPAEDWFVGLDYNVTAEWTAAFDERSQLVNIKVFGSEWPQPVVEVMTIAANIPNTGSFTFNPLKLPVQLNTNPDFGYELRVQNAAYPSLFASASIYQQPKAAISGLGSAITVGQAVPITITWSACSSDFHLVSTDNTIVYSTLPIGSRPGGHQLIIPYTQNGSAPMSARIRMSCDEENAGLISPRLESGLFLSDVITILPDTSTVTVPLTHTFTFSESTSAQRITAIVSLPITTQVEFALSSIPASTADHAFSVQVYPVESGPGGMWFKKYPTYFSNVTSSFRFEEALFVARQFVVAITVHTVGSTNFQLAMKPVNRVQRPSNYEVWGITRNNTIAWTLFNDFTPSTLVNITLVPYVTPAQRAAYPSDAAFDAECVVIATNVPNTGNYTFDANLVFANLSLPHNSYIVNISAADPNTLASTLISSPYLYVPAPIVLLSPLPSGTVTALDPQSIFFKASGFNGISIELVDSENPSRILHTLGTVRTSRKPETDGPLVPASYVYNRTFAFKFEYPGESLKGKVRIRYSSYTNYFILGDEVTVLPPVSLEGAQLLTHRQKVDSELFAGDFRLYYFSVPGGYDSVRVTVKGNNFQPNGCMIRVSSSSINATTDFISATSNWAEPSTAFVYLPSAAGRTYFVRVTSNPIGAFSSDVCTVGIEYLIPAYSLTVPQGFVVDLSQQDDREYNISWTPTDPRFANTTVYITLSTDWYDPNPQVNLTDNLPATAGFFKFVFPHDYLLPTGIARVTVCSHNPLAKACGSTWIEARTLSAGTPFPGEFRVNWLDQRSSVAFGSRLNVLMVPGGSLAQTRAFYSITIRSQSAQFQKKLLSRYEYATLGLFGSDTVTAAGYPQADDYQITVDNQTHSASTPFFSVGLEGDNFRPYLLDFGNPTKVGNDGVSFNYFAFQTPALPPSLSGFQLNLTLNASSTDTEFIPEGYLQFRAFSHPGRDSPTHPSSNADTIITDLTLKELSTGHYVAYGAITIPDLTEQKALSLVLKEMLNEVQAFDGMFQWDLVSPSSIANCSSVSITLNATVESLITQHGSREHFFNALITEISSLLSIPKRLIAAASNITAANPTQSTIKLVLLPSQSLPLEQAASLLRPFTSSEVASNLTAALSSSPSPTQFPLLAISTQNGSVESSTTVGLCGDGTYTLDCVASSLPPPPPPPGPPPPPSSPSSSTDSVVIIAPAVSIGGLLLIGVAAYLVKGRMAKPSSASTPTTLPSQYDTTELVGTTAPSPAASNGNPQVQIEVEGTSPSSGPTPTGMDAV